MEANPQGETRELPVWDVGPAIRLVGVYDYAAYLGVSTHVFHALLRTLEIPLIYITKTDSGFQKQVPVFNYYIFERSLYAALDKNSPGLPVPNARTAADTARLRSFISKNSQALLEGLQYVTERAATAVMLPKVIREAGQVGLHDLVSKPPVDLPAPAPKEDVLPDGVTAYNTDVDATRSMIARPTQKGTIAVLNHGTGQIEQMADAESVFPADHIIQMLNLMVLGFADDLLYQSSQAGPLYQQLLEEYPNVEKTQVAAQQPESDSDSERSAAGTGDGTSPSGADALASEFSESFTGHKPPSSRDFGGVAKTEFGPNVFGGTRPRVEPEEPGDDFDEPESSDPDEEDE